MMAFQLFWAFATVAPQRPPTIAWVEEEGRPSHHVRRFHTIPPNSAQMMVCEFTNCESTKPDDTVFATAWPTSAPIRLVIAASMIACRGVSTFVDTTVAIEFAVSWK